MAKKKKCVEYIKLNNLREFMLSGFMLNACKHGMHYSILHILIDIC